MWGKVCFLEKVLTADWYLITPEPRRCLLPKPADIQQTPMATFTSALILVLSDNREIR